MKKRICFLYTVLCIIVLSGCSFLGPHEDEDMELTKEDYETENYKTANPDTDLATSGNSVDALETVSIYTVDGIEESLVPLRVVVHTSRITPAFIVDEVLKNIDDEIQVTEILVEKSRIYIMLNEDYAPIKECSEKYETLILDCISNSVLDNLPYIDEVVFRSDSGVYRSDNFTFGAYEVYSSK